MVFWFGFLLAFFGAFGLVGGGLGIVGEILVGWKCRAQGNINKNVAIILAK